MTEIDTQAAPAPLQVRVKELAETKGPYEARLCKGVPTSCCDYGVVSLAEGIEVCRVWREQDARAIAAALDLSTPPQVAALEAEIVKLRGERDEALDDYMRRHRDVQQCVIRMARAEAEVARLTEALKAVRSSLQTELDRGVITDTLWMNNSPSETIFDALDTTLAALKESTNAQA